MKCLSHTPRSASRRTNASRDICFQPQGSQNTLSHNIRKNFTHKTALKIALQQVSFKNSINVCTVFAYECYTTGVFKSNSLYFINTAECSWMNEEAAEEVKPNLYKLCTLAARQVSGQRNETGLHFGNNKTFPSRNAGCSQDKVDERSVPQYRFIFLWLITLYSVSEDSPAKDNSFPNPKIIKIFRQWKLHFSNSFAGETQNLFPIYSWTFNQLTLFILTKAILLHRKLCP